MKRVITYGTFDLLHYGHINLLRRAKALGDYLIVCLSTDDFNWNEKKKKCYFSYEKRKALLEAIRYVDQVVPQENMDKFAAWEKYHFDAIFHGDDWKGSSMYEDIEKKLAAVGCDMVFLPHTDGISSTDIVKKIHG